MDIKVNLERNFTTEYNRLIREYGPELARLNGFSDGQLNYSEFIDNFIDTDTVADVSVDGNANVGHKDIVTLMHEMPKPHQKLLSFRKIYYEISKEYGTATANDWLEAEFLGRLYMHDSNTTSFVHYCFAYDLKDLAEKGLFFIDTFNAEPAKHLTTFVDFVKEFVSFTSNRSSGACGLPNLIPYMYYFWSRDVKNGYYTLTPEKYAKQNIQRLIYALNQPYTRDGIQSAFTNTSIFDHPYLEALFGGSIFPDGAMMIDEIEEIMEFQKVFLDVMSEIRSKNMMTFPVNSISLLKKDGKFVDEEFARYAIKHNMKWSDSNIFVDDSVNSLSNCPLYGETEILYYSKFYHKYISSQIKNVYNDRKGEDDTITVLSNGEEIECRINKFDIPADYKIELVNGAVIRTTANHLNKVLRGDYVETKELTTEDYLPISLTPFEKTDNMSYEDGKIVGMFLGDGSYQDNHGVVFSLNKDKKSDLISFLHDYCQKKYGATVKEYELESSLSGGHSCVNVSVRSDYIRGLISQFVVGDSALTKEINSLAYTQSIDFRRGILDGLYDTDGGNSNRIYTSSSKLKDSIVTLCATIGVATTVSEDNRDGRLGTNTCYTIRYYTPNGRTCRKDFYIIKDGYFWVRIKSVEKINDSQSMVSYCLEVVDEDVEPIFMLSNGIITHNCRLKSEIKDLYFNSIGGSALKVGSVKVSTINLARLALENETEDKYIKALEDLVVLDLKALDRVRHIIKRNVEKGLLNNFSCGLVDFEHLYSTIGFLGIYETMKTFGYINVDEFGNTYYTDDAERFGKKIFDTIHRIKDEFAKEKGYMVNCEQIPGETAAVKLMLKDKLFFGDKVVSDLPLYGNQFIPLGIKTTLQERIRIASMFDKFCNGGSILHVNIDAPFNNFDQAWDLLNYITDMGVTYFAFNTKIQACKNNHAFYGNVCPECGEPVETEYTRIVGFYTPVKSYSQERKEEYEMRRWEAVND